MEKIGNMDFESFKKIMDKQEKSYQRNLKTGSKLKKTTAKGKYAWSSTSDSGNLVEQYHRNVKSFDLAFDKVVECHLKRMKAWWKVEPNEVEIVGSPSAFEKYDWDKKVVTKEDVRKIVESDGKFVFRMSYKGTDEKKRGCWREWSSIHTMEALDKEENELKQQFQQ